MHLSIFRDIYGATAIHLAALRGYTRILSQAIAFGADLSLLDYAGRSILDYAMKVT